MPPRSRGPIASGSPATSTHHRLARHRKSSRGIGHAIEAALPALMRSKWNKGGPRNAPVIYLQQIEPTKLIGCSPRTWGLNWAATQDKSTPNLRGYRTARAFCLIRVGSIGKSGDLLWSISIFS